MTPFYKIALTAVLLVAIGSIYWFLQTPEQAPHVDTSDWVTYTNEEFGFSLMHPPEWQVHEAPDDLITPKFNIYKPGSNESALPYTHHTPDVTHVSIFPEGIPTEGISGEPEESSVAFSVPTQEPRDFLLSNGARWATFAGIPELSESGFIFSQTAVQNHTIDCFRGDELLDLQQCDPLTGDRVIHHGTINTTDRAIQEAMLASFTFEEIIREETRPTEVRLYYYNPDKDVDASGNIMCSDAGLVAVRRELPPVSSTEDVIRLLLRGELTPQERADGITTEYPLEGFELVETSREDGVLTLHFNDPNNATSGGSCRIGILWLQIRETAKQLDGVDEVQFMPETLFQP